MSGDKVVEFVPAERGFGSEDSDGAGLCQEGGRFHAWLHSDEGEGVVGAEGFDRDDGGRVAGEDDDFGALFDEVVGERDGSLENL